MNRFQLSTLRALTLASPLALVPAAQDGARIVVEAGTVHTLAGEAIQDGVIVIDDGRIVAVGKAGEVEKPWDATVLGGPDFVAFPGFVEAHTSEGMDRPNENVDVAPFLDIRDSIDPVAYYFEDCLRHGITTINIQQGRGCVIGGKGMIVRPTGMTVEEMAVRTQYGLKMSAAPKSGKSRATQIQALRYAFDDLRVYLEDLVATEKDDRGAARREALFQGRELEGEENKGRAMGGSAWKVEGLEMIPRGAIDEKYRPLLEIVEGRFPVYFACTAPMDVPAAVAVARENGFLERTVLVIDDACWKAADQIAASGCAVVLDGSLTNVWRDPVTGEEMEQFVPTVLAEKGIRFALSSENSDSRSLWYQAALAIGMGLSREQALAAVTTVPAGILGLADQVGTLEVGKLGNVCLYDGDPLSVTSNVEHVVIEGRHVYDRRLDLRNKHLLDGTQPTGTAPPILSEGDDEDEDQ